MELNGYELDMIEDALQVKADLEGADNVDRFNLLELLRKIRRERDEADREYTKEFFDRYGEV